MCRSHDGSSYGSGFTSGDGDGVGFAEFESYNSCLISYSVVEMVHAAIYIVLAVSRLPIYIVLAVFHIHSACSKFKFLSSI